MSYTNAFIKDGIRQILEKLDTIDEQNVSNYNLMQDVLTALGQQSEEKKLSIAERMAKMRAAKQAKKESNDNSNTIR